MKHLIFSSFSILTLFYNSSFSQAPSDLDLSFGDHGIVLSACTPLYNSVKSIAVQPDGKILAAGKVFNTSTDNYDFGLIRCNADGSADAEFGIDGKVTTDINSEQDDATALQLLEDGKILVAGYSNGHPSVVKYNPDGSLDETFGVDGISTIIPADPYEIGIYAMQIQTDGKIILGGTRVEGFIDNDFILIRLMPDGSIDESFGDLGFVVTDGEGFEFVNSLQILPDGNIISVGSTNLDGNYNLTLIRYLSDGTIDETYGTDGWVNAGGPSDWATSSALQSDGKIVVAGIHFNASQPQSIVAAKFRMDGSLDNSFDIDGIKYTNVSVGSADKATSLMLSSDNKLFIAGNTISDFTAAYDAFILSLNEDGSRNIDFSTDGIILTDFDTSAIAYSTTDEVNAITMQADGKILIGGAGAGNFSLARYLSEPLVEIINKQLKINSLQIFPNPVINDATLSYDLKSNQRISVYLTDISGKKIKTFIDDELQISGTHEQLISIPIELSDGNYFIAIKTNDQIMTVQIFKD